MFLFHKESILDTKFCMYFIAICRQEFHHRCLIRVVYLRKKKSNVKNLRWPFLLSCIYTVKKQCKLSTALQYFNKNGPSANGCMNECIV
jgi:hypothetical protein